MPERKYKYSLDTGWLEHLNEYLFPKAGCDIKVGDGVYLNAEGEAMPVKRQPPPDFIKPNDLTPVAPAMAKLLGLRPLVDTNGLRCAGLRIEEARNDYGNLGRASLRLRITCYNLPWRGELTVTGEVTFAELQANPNARREKLCKLLGELQYGIVEAEFRSMP